MTNSSKSIPPKDNSVLITQKNTDYQCGVFNLRITNKDWALPGLAPIPTFGFNDTMVLVVSEPSISTPKRPLNLYELERFNFGSWYSLKNRHGAFLDIHVLRSRTHLEIHNGAPPNNTIVLGVSDYSSEKKFTLQLNGPKTKNAFYSHPENDYSLLFKWDFLTYGRTMAHLFRVSTTLSSGYVEVVLDGLPEQKWHIPKHPEGDSIPLRVYKNQNQVEVEWLAINDPLLQNTSKITSSKSDAKYLSIADPVIDVVIAEGIKRLTKWLSTKL